MLLHGALIVGAVVAGLFATRSEAPRRIYNLTFEARDADLELDDEFAEELASLELEAVPLPAPDEEPELLPEPVHPRPDPSALVDPEPLEVPGAQPFAVSSEMVFGFDSEPEEVAASITPQPAESDKAAPPQPADSNEPAPPNDLGAPSASPVEPLVLVRIEGADPTYPRVSQRKREEGDVVLRLVIDTKGRVTLVELAESSGYRRLDQAAMSAAPTWRFEVPTTGPPESFQHTVHFRLERR